MQAFVTLVWSRYSLRREAQICREEKEDYESSCNQGLAMAMSGEGVVTRGRIVCPDYSPRNGCRMRMAGMALLYHSHHCFERLREQKKGS